MQSVAHDILIILVRLIYILPHVSTHAQCPSTAPVCPSGWEHMGEKSSEYRYVFLEKLSHWLKVHVQQTLDMADGVMGVLAPSPSPSPSLTIITSKEGPTKVFELISCPEPVETSPLHFTHNNNHWFKAFPEQRKERSSWLQVCRWKMMKLSETFSYDLVLLLYWILGLRVTINKDLSFSLTVQVYLSATTWMCGLWFIKQKEKNECI